MILKNYNISIIMQNDSIKVFYIRKKFMVPNINDRMKSGGQRKFNTGLPMAIVPLWSSRVSGGLFYPLMMEVKNVGEINDSE